MPKVSEAHRESRRDQIAAAALACFAEKGFQRTSMADIIAASGLSAGAIYLHFPGKQQIALEVARRVLSRRLGEFGELADPLPVDPIEALERLLGGMIEEMPDSRVLLQLWGEAASDPELAGLVDEVFARLRSAWAGYLTVWAESRGIPGPDAWARRTVPVILGLAQGFIMQRALIADFDADDYFRTIRTIVGPELRARRAGTRTGSVGS
jgi:AcrR family transcriptional regulator